MRRLHLFTASFGLLAIPAYAGTVWYQIRLVGPGRNTVEMKVDTREMQNGTLLRRPPFTAVVTRNNGTAVPLYFRLGNMEPGKIYQSSIAHGVAGAKYVTAANVNWAMDRAGLKEDGGIGPKTDDVGTETADPPAGIVTHCKNYTQIAIQQFNDARNRQCGFGGNRWSANYQHHYQWCVGVLVPESNGETQARANMITQCAKK